MTRPDPGAPEHVIKRLEAERAAADARYNEALTAVDRALRGLPEWPSPPPAFDEFQITPLNELWAIADGHPPHAPGWRGRLAAFVWRVVGPRLQRQQAFNSAVVDHVNRNVALHRETVKAITTTIAVLHEQLGGIAAFQQHLILYLQQITPYVDTRDREIAGRMIGLSAAIDGVGDELGKRWESMVAREKRYEARVAALEQIRDNVATVHQATQAIRRELEGLVSSHVALGGENDTAVRAEPVEARTIEAGQTMAASLRSYRYVGFEDQFRGSQDDIRHRVEEYLPCFEGASDVLDIGCGRGEFLDLLRERGIRARGLDLNREMVEVCRARGLDADHGDALSYLTAQPDGSLGGLFAAQVVEHLQPDYLAQLIDTAFLKLRPGSRVVLETINPACWAAFFESYIRDITHVRPLHPDTLKYLVVASGFQRVEVRFRAPFPEDAKLQAVTAAGGALATDGRLVTTFNENVAKLNALMFSYLDYAVIGERL